MNGNTVILQDLLEEYFNSRRASRLLDLGCGDGAATRRLLLAGLRPERVTGVDPEETGFSPEVRREDLPAGGASAPRAWEFVRADAHAALMDAFPPGGFPDIVLFGRMLHHVRRFGRLLSSAAALVRRGNDPGYGEGTLVVWEPVAAAGPFSELHRIKTDVDRALGLWHRSPFDAAVLERVLRGFVRGDDIRWDVLRVVQPSREPYTVSEYSAAIEDMNEYIGLVQDRPAIYARLKRRLNLLPRTPESQPFGEPLLLAVSAVSSYR